MKRRGNFKNKGLMREQREIVDKFFFRHRIGFKILMKMASKTDKWKDTHTHKAVLHTIRSSSY